MSELPRETRQKLTEFFVIFVVLFGFALLSAVPIQAAIEVAAWLKDGHLPHFTLREFLGSNFTASITHTSFLGLNVLVEKALDLWVSMPIGLLGVLWFFMISAVWK